ncbi:MAG TPA: CoA transferase [Chloroflexota bacterium]|nr:CoA transferase [Chloroflexota bacterium]
MISPAPPARRPPLDGVRVLDLATLFAGPLVATFLGDFGAEVIKVEHPRGDPVRGHGHARNGIGLWAKMINRNKRMLSLDLSKTAAQEILGELAAHSDVVIENFRPGTLERWHVGPDQLQARNPKLVVVRMTAFGQFGPYANRPGFGTIAESLSGFASITGQADGPPTLPPFGLADGIAGLAGTIATMMALYARDAAGGTGQVIDVAIIEPILTILGAQITVFDQLGILQQRTGNRSYNNAPRNTYRTRDEKWVAISASSQSVAERVLRLVGHPEVIGEPWFATGAQRAQHADELDGYVSAWIAQRNFDDVMRAFEEAEAAVAPIYDAADVMRDPQFAALESIITVPDEELGPLKMQNVLFRLMGTPGRVRWSGRRIGQDTEAILAEIGKTTQQVADLRASRVI